MLNHEIVRAVLTECQTSDCDDKRHSRFSGNSLYTDLNIGWKTSTIILLMLSQDSMACFHPFRFFIITFPRSREHRILVPLSIMERMCKSRDSFSYKGVIVRARWLRDARCARYNPCKFGFS